MGMSIKTIKTAGFVLAVFSCSVVFGQENSKTNVAESIFDEYLKFGVTSGMSVMYVTNEPNPLNYRYLNFRTWNIGAFYNFYQSGNFNFKVGAIYRQYKIVSEDYMTEEVTGYFDVGGISKFGPHSQWRFPIIMEYFVPINENLSYSLGLGPEFLLYRRDISSGSSLYYGGEVDAVGLTSWAWNQGGFLQVGINASVGLNIETGPLLLQPAVTFHYQPQALLPTR